MLIGHYQQWQFLKASANMQKLPHGLLFYGPEQLGKKTLALEFVKYLNCQSESLSQKPCRACRNCQEIQRETHPDLMIIGPQPGKNSKFFTDEGEITISQIRDLAWKLSLRPYSSDFKVAILDKAHLMNQEAQSCFLKLLEEPRGKALLILITEYPEMLFPTILSRVQKIRFFPVNSIEIEDYLFSQGVPRDKAKYLASFSFGKPGRAHNFLSDNQAINNQNKIISDLVKIGSSDLVYRFQYAKNLFEEDPDSPSPNLKEILEVWLRYFRGLLHSHLNSPSQKSVGNKAFNGYSLSKLENILKILQATIFLVSRTNINPRLALENFIIEL